MQKCKLDADKGIVYSNRVRIGNWYEASKLEEHKLNVFLDQMKKGDLMLARYRKMTENLNSVSVLTQSTGSIAFGSKISLLAPHVPSTDPPREGETGLLLGGRISSNDINYSQELEDGCSLVGMSNIEPTERSAFILTSADYCDRESEDLKYNQEFLLALSSSVNKKQPLYMRFDPNPIPGLNGMYPLYLSKHPVSNTRWRVLPKMRPDLTRFEQEGKSVVYALLVLVWKMKELKLELRRSTLTLESDNLSLWIIGTTFKDGFSAPHRIKTNTDVIINHCATNTNLGINIGCWATGFHRKICAPLMRTCLDIYGRELPNNIWQIYTPIPKEK